MQAVLLSQQGWLVTAYPLKISLVWRIVAAIIWMLFSWLAAWAVWQKRPFCRPLVLALIGGQALYTAVVQWQTATNQVEIRMATSGLVYGLIALLASWLLRQPHPTKSFEEEAN